jgi:hypothetical protein
MAWFGSSAKRVAPKEPKSGDSATGGLRHPGIHTVGTFGPERLLRIVPSRLVWCPESLRLVPGTNGTVQLV